MRYILRNLPLYIIALGVLSLAGCDPSDNPLNPGGTDTTGFIRAIHLSYDAPGMDVRVDGSVIIQSIRYRNASKFMPIDTGGRQIAVHQSGGVNPMINASHQAKAGAQYTLCITGPSAALEGLMYVDDRTVRVDKARVRIINAIPDISSIKCLVARDTGQLTLVNNLATRIASKYLDVDPGDLVLQIMASSVSGPRTQFTSASINAGQRYTVIFDGTFDDTDNRPLRALLLNDSGDGSEAITLSSSVIAKMFRLPGQQLTSLRSGEYRKMAMPPLLARDASIGSAG